MLLLRRLKEMLLQWIYSSHTKGFYLESIVVQSAESIMLQTHNSRQTGDIVTLDRPRRSTVLQ